MNFTIKQSTRNTKLANLGYISVKQPYLESFIIPGLTTTKTKDPPMIFARLSGGTAKLIVKFITSNLLANNEVIITKEHMEFIGLDEGENVQLEPIPDGLHRCTLAGEVKVLAYMAKFEETGCASDIEDPFLKLDKMFVKMIRDDLLNHVMYTGQKIYIEYQGKALILFVNGIQSSESAEALFGGIGEDTVLSVTKFFRNEPFHPGVDPDDISSELKKRGIGGMEKIFSELLNTLFKHNYLPLKLKKALKIRPIRGVLFHGPPGTGKTLIARNFCQIILCVTPKVVNGPEIMDYYHGKSEKNVRSLFDAAIRDFKKYGLSSPLHVVIFDELDSVARKRGESKSEHLGDRVVNQLLTMLDGVSSTPNLLVLATTNRKDLIDPALLRPGRIERDVYVGFPTHEEAVEILKLKTKPFMDHGLIDKELDLNQLAKWTKDFSGADLEALVSSCFNGALADIPFSRLGDVRKVQEDVKIDLSSFKLLLAEHIPEVGI